MCGIAGIAYNDPTRPADRAMLGRMTAIIRHRGPDSEGFHVDEGIGLGVRRLSIIDPEHGNQPISNEDGTITVICNGEIYNYRELRERLLAGGHRFRSGSDIEVIAHLYEENPDGFLQQLRGMFGLALWDARRRRLVLARDRLGIKPLHYASTPQGIVFGSELKAVLASGLIHPRIDPQGLQDLFTLGFVVTPRTMIEGVHRLPPGHWLSFSNGTATSGAYWDVAFPQRDRYDVKMTDDEWADALRERLAESVRVHLRSDVPAGVWLSSGIDSSSIAALMHEELQQPIHSFTLGFDSIHVDELAGKRLLDDYSRFGLLRHRTTCQQHHLELLPTAIWHREQPFGVGVDIPRMLLSAMTAEHVKVVLTGEGADEILGGYPWYLADKALSPLSALPLPVRRIAAHLLKASGRWPNADRILMAPDALNLERFRSLIGRKTWLPAGGTLFSPELTRMLAGKREDGEDFKLPDAFGTWHRFAQLQYFDLKLRMPETVIQHLDLLSMAHSVEARVPFLDHTLVEFCATIPPWVKMRGWTEKSVLRQAMRDILPQDICRRKKFSMSAPTRDWMGNELPAGLADHLTERRLRDTELFDPAAVATIVKDHLAGRGNHSQLLMMIMGTQVWADLFLRRFPPMAIGATSTLDQEGENRGSNLGRSVA